MITRTSILLAAAMTAVATTQGIAASPSEEREIRGFNTCVNAAEATNLTGITTKRDYFLRETADRNVYYVNVLGWEASDWVAKRVRCEISANGRTLFSAEMADGRYTTDEQSVLQVSNRLAKTQRVKVENSASAGD